MKWFLGGFLLSLDYFVPAPRLLSVAVVVLMYLSHKTSLVSVKTLVLLSCFPMQTFPASLFLLYMAIYFCKNNGTQFHGAGIRRNTCTRAFLLKPWYSKSFISVASLAKRRLAWGNKELSQMSYGELYRANHILIPLKWTTDKIREIAMLSAFKDRSALLKCPSMGLSL